MTLTDFILKNGLTRAKFAKMIGVQEESVTRYINGTRMPRRKQIERIHKVTKGAVTANDILQQEAA